MKQPSNRSTQNLDPLSSSTQHHPKLHLKFVAQQPKYLSRSFNSSIFQNYTIHLKLKLSQFLQNSNGQSNKTFESTYYVLGIKNHWPQLQAPGPDLGVN